jgi:hypothetical protein
LAKLIEAAEVIDEIFREQIWSGNAALMDHLSKDSSPLGKARYHYYLINNGPWSDLDNHAVFIPDAPPQKLPGANFYPADMTKAEFETWLKKLPQAQQEQATGFFSVIRRDADKELSIVPYSQAYSRDLTRAAALLNQAADATPQRLAQEFPASAGSGVPGQRLLRERRGVDAARRAHRRDHRALRDIQRRPVRIQGRV